MRKLNTKEFISKARMIHGKKYDYSSVEYKTSNMKVIISCPIHGTFLQKPNKHLNGRGCAVCGRIKSALTITKSSHQFVSDANKVHRNKYDYSDVKYIGAYNKIRIYCPIHGTFFQFPHDHLNGKGCYKCGRQQAANKTRKTEKQFIKDAMTIHGNKYNYSKSKYINDSIKIRIMCPKHGYFYQKPNSHLNGNECPKCRGTISKLETDFLNYLNIKERQKYISVYRVDGYDPAANIIYEFLGDYWHGNLQRFSSNEYNIQVHKTFGQLHEEVFSKFKRLKELGYDVKYIWESDWKLWSKNKSNQIPLKNY